VDGVVETGGCERYANCEERVHLVSFFLELVIDCGTVLKLLCAGDEEENIGKGFGSVRVAAEHHVCETNIVVCLVMTGGHSHEHCLWSI